MTIRDFIGVEDQSIIYFSAQLTSEVNLKIKQKKLFYKEQVWKFVQKRVNAFVNSLNVRPALKAVFRNQINTTIDLKINALINSHHLLSCL